MSRKEQAGSKRAGSCWPWGVRGGERDKHCKCVRKMLRCFPRSLVVIQPIWRGLEWAEGEYEETFGDLGQKMMALHPGGGGGGNSN